MSTLSSGFEDSNPCAAEGIERQGSSAGQVYQECRSTRPVNNAVISEARRMEGGEGEGAPRK